MSDEEGDIEEVEEEEEAPPSKCDKAFCPLLAFGLILLFGAAGLFVWAMATGRLTSNSASAAGRPAGGLPPPDTGPDPGFYDDGPPGEPPVPDFVDDHYGGRPEPDYIDDYGAGRPEPDYIDDYDAGPPMRNVPEGPPGGYRAGEGPPGLRQGWRKWRA
ncbi:hypothetical protein F53441_8983 [Fusarium austroafricanum]|uniref:Uncharacterized protein n=1 Tax=Fusarium austroafricanum TaxID=2364996 RepID=A0A8H4KCV4_9HYPO|nr:hypothetical protein F53441_8983 [Fusarium austroafricanum]